MKSFFDRLPRWTLPPGCGVVTATDAGFFPGCQFLCRSLKGRAPVHLFDLGLDAKQRTWCDDNGMSTSRLADNDLYVPRSVPGWQTWNKALFISMSPFEHTLWIDADCLVVNDLTPLFAVIARQPLVVLHPDGEDYRGGNTEELYDNFPVTTRLSPQQTINAGVLGFSKNDRSGLLDCYAYMTRKAKLPSIREMIG